MNKMCTVIACFYAKPEKAGELEKILLNFVYHKPGDLSLSLFCSSFNMFFSRAGSQAVLQPGSLARALAREISRLTSLGLAFLLITAVAGRVSSQSVDPVQALAALQSKILSKGPNGEEPAPASSVSLSPEEIEKIRGLKAKAAIVLHYSRNDWSEAQVAGLKSQFDKMGIEVTAVTDAGFIAERQVANIESVLMQKPQIIVSIPTDAVFTAAAYKKASQQGVKLVFMDNVPQGFEPGKDYVSVV